MRAIPGGEIASPGGETLGTLENLVIVSGGLVVAAIVKPADGEPLALPCQPLKDSTAASGGEAIGLSLPMSLEDARGMETLRNLTGAALGDRG